MSGIAATPAWRQRQPDMDPQSLRNPVLGSDRAVHRFDVAACDPQADPEIGRRRFVRRVRAAFGIIPVEDALQLLIGHAWAAIGNGQMGEAAVMSEVDQNLAARWRE